MKPLNVREWLEPLAMHDDFAREALEIVDLEEYSEECRGIVDYLETEQAKAPIKASDPANWFVDRSNLLSELSDMLAQAGFVGDPDDALQNLLDELEELRTENSALKVAQANQEYDL